MGTDAPPDRLAFARFLAEHGARKAYEGDLAAARALYLEAFDVLGHRPGLDVQDRNSALAAVPSWTTQESEMASSLYTALGNLAFRGGNLDDAEVMLETALELARRGNHLPAVGANLSNLGVVHRYRGDLDAALARYKQAWKIEKRVGVPSYDVAVTLNNIGRIHHSKGDLDSAEQFYRRAECLANGDKCPPLLAANIRSNLGGVALDRGAIAAAVDHYRAALDATLGVAHQSQETARCHNNLGYAYWVSGDPNRARYEYDQALKIDQALAPTSLETARDLINIAGVRREANDLQAARRLYERARRILRTVAPESVEMASCLTSIGRLRELAGDLNSALRYYRRALRVDETAAPGSAMVAADHNNIGGMLRDLGNLREALRHAQRALEIEQSLGGGTDGTAQAWHNLSVYRYELGDHDGAISDARRSIEATQILRSQAGADWARERVFARHESAYSQLIDWLYRRGRDGDHDEAFTRAEQFRARVLLELLNEREITIRARTRAQQRLIADERHARRALAALHEQCRRAAENRDGSLAARLTAQQRGTEEILDRLIRAIRDDFPEYAQLRAPAPVDLAEAQQQLLGNELLLAYCLGPDECYGWAVRATGSVMFPLGISSSGISELLDTALAPYRAGHSTDTDATRAQQKLSHALLNAVPARLWQGVRRLVVVPDGPLAYLPFDLLAAPAGGLIADRMITVHCPSASVFINLRQRRRGAHRPRGTHRFVGFGGIDPMDEPGAVGSDRSASPLPAARREIRALAHDFAPNGAAYLAAAVTEHAIRTLAPRYQYVHFAAHAVLDDDDPLYSGLIVAPPTDTERSLDADGDDFLQVYEMFDLRLSADVVMCSACQTAGGHIRAGEGLIGMSRALLFAGARSLVLTAWPVADYPTERLARRFYEELRHRRSPGTALAVAKQAVRASHPHVYGDPFAWAGLVLIGHR